MRDGVLFCSMRACSETLVVAAMAMAACAHGASNRAQLAPSRETAAPSSTAQPPVSLAAAAPQAVPHGAEPSTGSAAPPPLPQSDPIPPPAPRCPSLGALVKASAVVKREPPSRAQPTSPAIFDIELSVALPTNPIQATFAQNHLTVYGGVLLQQTLKPAERTNAVVLIRPSWTVAHEGSLRALFGVECKAGEGNLRVDMSFASPTHEGDKVTIGGVDGY